MLGFKRKETRSREKLLAVLGGHDLPSFPKLALETIQKIRDPDSETADIAALVERDMGLVARVFRLVNSAAFGVARPIDSVQHAISYLGRSQLEQVVLALVVRDALPQGAAPGFDYARHWKTAFFRGVLSRHLASQLHPAREGASFTVGLLQDMAIPVLAHAKPDEYGEVLEAWHRDAHLSLASLERDKFGWSHAEVGNWIGREWGLPDELVAAITDHHADGEDADCLPAARLVALLHEADPTTSRELLIEGARSGYGLDADWLVGALEASAAQADELASQLG